MNMALQQRLRFIDFVLDRYGVLNRGAIQDYFGVSSPQASIDIREYIKLAPDNIRYDKSIRAYVITEQFERRYP